MIALWHPWKLYGTALLTHLSGLIIDLLFSSFLQVLFSMFIRFWSFIIINFYPFSLWLLYFHHFSSLSLYVKYRIHLFRNPDKITPSEHTIVQEYLDKPFLLDGYKMDLRLYALVTQCDPLRIFLYQDGLVRLSTEKYANPTEENMVSQKNIPM